MRIERARPIFWLVVVGSWVAGFVYGRWFGSPRLFFELSQAVRVTTPIDLGIWWEVIAYFALSTVSVFLFSHVLFGVGGAIFLFSRGVYDSHLFSQLEFTVHGWSLLDIPMTEVWLVVIIALILAVNLPLCLWSGQLGIQRAFYTFSRLRGKPIDPKFGSEPISDLIWIFVASLGTGVIAALLYSHL